MSDPLGAVPRPTDAGLIEYITKLQVNFPDAVGHINAFRRLGSEYVYAAEVRHGDARKCWVALVRFGTRLESIFGFTREVMVVYSPYSDLQSRLFNALPDMISALPRDIDTNTLFLCAPDKRLAVKLDDWSDPWFTAVPLPRLSNLSDEAANTIVRSLRARVFTRNLYYETTAVWGDRFFGRRQLLRALLEDVRSRSVCGIFGLRKSGKTSLLRQLQRLAGTYGRDQDRLFVIRDLESLPSPPLTDPVPYLMRELAAILVDRGGAATSALRGLPDNATPVDFKLALQTALRILHRQNKQLVLALDEIEHLLPPNIMDHGVELPQIPQLLGVFRSLAQEEPNFSFILSGLTSWITEEGWLYGRPNPLYSYAKTYFLSTFSPAEAAELADGVGRKMGVSWSPEALERAYFETGGHPYLYRSLAAEVVETLPHVAEKRSVGRERVEQVTRSWRRKERAKFREMINHLESYYPEEALLLRDMARSSGSGVGESESDASFHLLQLGLAVEGSGGALQLSRLGHLVSGTRQPEGGQG